MKTMAIVVRDSAYDKILTPLAFAYLEAAEGVQVDVLFVNWAVRAMKQGGAAEFKVDAAYADKDQWVRDQVAKAGMPSDLYELIQAIKETDSVNFYACSLAATVFDVPEESLIPECSGIVGASWFLHEKAAKADHYQYF